MRRLLLATALAAAVLPVTERPAEAWGGGILLGTAVGLTAGTIVGAAVVHPYGYYPYPFPYYYPPVAYAAPYGYGYPAPVYPPPGYGQPAPAGYVPPAPARSRQASPATAECKTGQFFNTYTGNCDRR